ncbi:MAG: hypothetical protein ACTSUD_05505 [Alphaproteobacteria bacterium]
MGDSTTAALIGASVAVFSTIVTLIVRDGVLPHIVRNRESAEKKKHIYERYAHPIASAAESLYFRLTEIVESKRFSFLDQEAAPYIYNTYKRISTAYRIAAMIGWIRALRLEQSYLLQSEKNPQHNLRAAIARFESALADGPHVESDILTGLLEIWDIDLPPKADREFLEARVDNLRIEGLFSKDGRETEIFRELPKMHKLAAVEKICLGITDGAGLPPIQTKIVKETLDRAAEILTVRQSWIYRDWQNAIGNRMLINTDSAVRKFDVIDYGTFEETHKKDKWLPKIDNILVDLNFDAVNKSEYRTIQVSKLLQASANIIVEVDKINLNADPSTHETVESAKKCLSRFDST